MTIQNEGKFRVGTTGQGEVLLVYDARKSTNGEWEEFLLSPVQATGLAELLIKHSIRAGSEGQQAPVTSHQSRVTDLC